MGIFTKKGLKSGIKEKEVKDWLNDGLRKGYSFHHLKQILTSHGLKDEADRLVHLFPETIRAKEERSYPRKAYSLKTIGVVLLFVFAFIFASVFISNYRGSLGTSHIISNAQNPGALVNVDFSKDVGIVRSDFYGATTHGTWGSNLSFIDTNGDGILDAYSNYTWQRNALQDSKINYIRADMSLYRASTGEGTFDKTTNLSNYRNLLTRKNTVDYARANGMKVLFTAGYMPVWLANTTSGYCTGDDSSCTPSNYTKWGQLVVDYLNAVGCDATTCAVEVWNEPDTIAFWMNNVSKISGAGTRSIEYNKLYNATYLAVKSAFPTMQVGGPVVAGNNDDTALIFENFMSNFSNQVDFISYHHYLGNGESYTDFSPALANDYSWIYGNITAYNANVSRVLIDEYNVQNSSMIVNDPDRWAEQLGQTYEVTLNSYPSNVSLFPYEWGQDNAAPRGNGGTYWEAVSEPALNNTYYASYNITKNFATYHSAGSTVVKSNSSLSSIKIVASEKNNSSYITIINSGSGIDVGLNIFGENFSEITDLGSGEVYNITDGGVYLGSVNQYQIRYFSISNSSTPSEQGTQQVGSVNNIVGSGGGGSSGQCDNANLSSQTCESLGYASGTLSYDSGCILNTSQCVQNSTAQNSTSESSGVQNSTESITNSNGITNKGQGGNNTGIMPFIFIFLVIGILVLIFFIARIFVKKRKIGNLNPDYSQYKNKSSSSNHPSYYSRYGSNGNYSTSVDNLGDV